MKREGGEVWERKEGSFLLTREKRREILREGEELGEETPLATEIISVAREGGVRWIEKENAREETRSGERAGEERREGRERKEEKRKRKKEERERKRNPEERKEERERER